MNELTHAETLAAEIAELGRPQSEPSEFLVAAGDNGDPAHEEDAAHDEHGAHDEHAAHGEGGDMPDHYIMPHEIPNLATWVEVLAKPKNYELHDGHRAHPSSAWFINPIFSIGFMLLIVYVLRKTLTRPSVKQPNKLQVAVELLLGGLRDFFLNILGPRGEKFIPYCMALFLFIWINNIGVLIPGLKSPSSRFQLTVGLGLLTFFYVHFNTIKEGGFKNWFMHLVGEPLWLSWLLFPLHVMGELIKPVSLSVRLFGNIFGEDKLLAVFLGLGMLLVAVIFGTTKPPLVGIPLHLPFFFLVLLLSTIQAMVFSLLAAIYIALLLPHDHEEKHEHGHA